MGYAAELSKQLSALKRPGDFAVSSVLPVSHGPGLVITGVDGVIPLPLQPQHAVQIRQHCEQAPFGRRDQTIVDTAVRNTWQLDPANFQLTDAGWPAYVQQAVKRCCGGLGVSKPSAVQPQLYKLLLYEAGGFFAPHRDTEKAEGMFATLSILLPSKYEGGQLKITHGDTPKMVDFSQNSDYKTCAVAFYADCQHELLRVTSGYRLCLIYNLVHVGQGAPPAAIDRTAAVQALCPILERWAADDNGPKKLVWLLEHRYSQAGLKSVASLKAQDRAVADTLWAAAKAAGADVYLATFVRREQGPAEGGYAGIPSTFVEVDSYSHYCKDWVSLDGQRLTFKQMPVEGDKEFIRDGLNSERLAFEKEEINEATGNAGARMDRWYNQAALVVWPRKHRVANLMRGSATALAQELRAALLRDPASAAATLKEVVAQLCTVEVDAAALKGVQEVILAAQAEECAQQFVSGALPKFLREQQYKDDAKRAAAAIDLAAPLYTRFISPAMFQSMQTLTKTLLKKYRVVQPLLELLLLVAQTPCAGEAQKFPFETRELQHMMVHVLDIVEREAVAFSRFQPDEWYYMLPAAAGSATVTALLVALSKCLLRGCQASSATAGMRLLWRYPAYFPLQTALVPGFLAAHAALTADAAAAAAAQPERWSGSGWVHPVHQLLAQCHDSLKAVVWWGPSPSSWRVDAHISCSCATCWQLDLFLASANRQAEEFALVTTREGPWYYQGKKELPACTAYFAEQLKDSIAKQAQPAGRGSVVLCKKPQHVRAARLAVYQSAARLLQQVRAIAPTGSRCSLTAASPASSAALQPTQPATATSQDIQAQHVTPQAPAAVAGHPSVASASAPRLMHTTPANPHAQGMPTHGSAPAAVPSQRSMPAPVTPAAPGSQAMQAHAAAPRPTQFASPAAGSVMPADGGTVGSRYLFRVAQQMMPSYRPSADSRQFASSSAGPIAPAHAAAAGCMYVPASADGMIMSAQAAASGSMYSAPPAAGQTMAAHPMQASGFAATCATSAAAALQAVAAFADAPASMQTPAGLAHAAEALRMITSFADSAAACLQNTQAALSANVYQPQHTGYLPAAQQPPQGTGQVLAAVTNRVHPHPQQQAVYAGCSQPGQTTAAHVGSHTLQVEADGQQGRRGAQKKARRA